MTFSSVSAFIHKHKYPLLLLTAVLALCVVPLACTSLYTGHDFKFHLCRITCIGDNIGQGKWFAPIYYSYFGGYGYASPMFYGDLFLHIPGLLYHWGMSAHEALKVFLMLVTAATAFSSYYCTRRIFKNELAAFVTSMVYTFSSYFCVDMIVRTALGELQAFIFLPVIVLGFYSIVFENSRSWYWLPLGLAGCVLSHVLTAVAAVVFLAVFSLIYFRNFLENKKRFAYVALSAGVFFALTAFFVFPMLEQLSSYDFPVNNGKAALQWGTLSMRAMPIIATVSDFAMKFNTGEWIPNGVGLMSVATVTAAISLRFKKAKTGKALPILVGAAVLCLILTTNIFPWKALQSLLGSLQFPWRLLMFATLFFALAAGCVVLKAPTKSFAALFALCVIAFSCYSYIITGSDMYANTVKRLDKQNASIEYLNTIGAGEYMPVTRNTADTDWVSAAAVKGAILNRGDKVTSNAISASGITFEHGFGTVTAEFNGNRRDDTYLEFPLMMYKGYAATVNGEPAECVYGKNNIVRVYIGNAESGTVRVWYKGTPLRTFSYIVSIASLAVFIVYLIIVRKKKAPTPSQTHIPAQDSTE